MQINTAEVAALMRQAGMGAAASALENGEAVLGTICEVAGFKPTPMATMSQVQQMLDQQQTTATRQCATTGRNGAGQVPAWNLPGAVPACYNKCTPVNECLLPLLNESRSRFDDHAWMYLWLKDPQILHMSKIVSSATAPYLSAFPLTDNAKIILAQQDSQQLPYLPGYFKVDWRFSVADAKDKVIVRIFTGPRGLTGLTGTSALTPVGDDYRLSDFDCKDDCYFLPFPDLLGCKVNGIPDTRSLYIELEAEGLGGGGNQMSSINFSMLKRGTKKYMSDCSTYKLEMF